jgi:hypothetical protein
VELLKNIIKTIIWNIDQVMPKVKNNILELHYIFHKDRLGVYKIHNYFHNIITKNV